MADIDNTPIEEAVPCSEIKLPKLNNNFVVTDNGVYITDSCNGYILEV